MNLDTKSHTRATFRRSIREAYEGMHTKYNGLAGAPRSQFGSKVWKMQVLSWVVGTRGVLDVDGIRKAMAFMEIPEPRQKSVL